MAGELIPQIVIEAAQRRGSVDEIVSRWICLRISAAADGQPKALGRPFRFRRGLLAAQGKAPARSCGRDGHPLQVGAAADRNSLNDPADKGSWTAYRDTLSGIMPHR